ncbi:MAG: AI-2E family transporter [Rhodobacteraceae bacterium]|jgi:predicted PurR-regulated permease PerM|nr:AI-2E family transporter [Paracoccaceae bacterium]MBL4556700.1 AI-2E family transporter [Paracoccaceae bacterium]HBG98175.1 AI-2E family transporter [Paracoccaceae bacterium]
MAEEHPHHEYYWIAGIAASLAALWFLGDVILPFVIGAAIAYFLDPVADRLERLGLSRALATTIVMLGTALVFVLVLLLILPVFISQLGALLAALPDLFAAARAFAAEHLPDISDTASPARQTVDGVVAVLQDRAGGFVQGLIASVNSLIGIVLLFVIAPVVAFYLLLDWDHMVAAIDDLLPRRDAPTIRQLAAEIDRTLAGFVRGQLTVCLILGVFYAVALMAVGLEFGLVVGLIAGLLSFIPWVGSLVGGALSIGLALFQFWGWTCTGADAAGQAVTAPCPFSDSPWMIGIVAAIFATGQMVEGNILTPKLVGGSVGLHPVWLLFALSVFGAVFGFVGMLVAVPVAAMLGVLVRFAIAQYRAGRFYRGGGGPAP